MKRLKREWLAAPLMAAVLLTCASARAQDYGTSAPPVQAPPAIMTMPSGPIAPGTITMEDVLKAHPPQPQLPIQPIVAAPPPTTTAPQLSTTPSQESSTGLMMMQGLKTVLQQSGNPATPLLKPPIMPGNEAIAAQRAAAAQAAGLTPAGPVSESGIVYQPGQAPKDLATEALQNVPANSTPPPSASAASVPTQATAEGGATPASSGTCRPQTTSWTKTCADAGYPDNFTGAVQGETHTVCPAGTLQDVWVSNTCAAPNNAETGGSEPLTQTAAAPLSAPAAPQNAVASLASVNATPTDQNDGSCGPVNGMAIDHLPTADLCSSGSPSPVTGEGPWRWSCNGFKDGMTVSCAATVAPHPNATIAANSTAAAATPAAVPVVEDAICGSANGVGAGEPPSGNLCNKGEASRVSGDGPWTWACSGMNGGQAAACSAPRITDGACGAASGAPTDQMPTSDLCAAGLASAVNGSGPWNWTCSGLYGGQAASCAAAPKQDAVCGTASTRGHKDMPHDNLCSIGQASAVSGEGPWSWTCNGANGGSPVSCEAPISANGACGVANGVAVSEAPSDDLCAHGNASRVTGTGPWSWNCEGEAGGNTESCTAPRASASKTSAASAKKEAAKETTAAVAETAPKAAAMETSSSNMCGSAAELAALAAPEKDLCKGGKASKVSGDGPWTWTCSDNDGHTSACSTLSPDAESADASPAPAADETPATPPPPPAPVTATCGSAASQPLTEAPEDNLCEVGNASKLRGTGPWTWNCTKGKSKVSCQAAKVVDGICGVTNGSAQKRAPTSGLCNTGTPTDIQGTGPWLWSCVGSGGGASASCSAASQAQAHVDGACGVAANEPTTTAPAANLCDSGAPSSVYGEGPWTWTCSGLNGGIASSCSAQKNIPPAPPPPGPPINGLCGDANGTAMLTQPMDSLCSTGAATQVSGNGPWNWDCIGENGGMTVSCTASLQPPPPITGACGSGNGVPTLTRPTAGLCSAGISSAVSGKGPWTWSCSGTNGGGAVGCVAPLAGDNVGSMPSVTAIEPGAPNAAPQVPVTSGRLVTPTLPSGTLPPLETGTLPELTPSKAFERPPEPSAMPPVPAPDHIDMAAPPSEPSLPEGASPIPPPPVRDTLKPAPALQSGFDEQGNTIPGNHFVLDDDISTIPFAHGSENIDPDEVSKLDKLAEVLHTHPGLRVTLTAYADVEGSSPRDARRLSLSRALTIRDYLTAKTISSARIDVRALGANVPSGDPDRVDVKAN